MHNFKKDTFSPERFSASVEAKNVKEFLKVAKNFPGDTGLVPCWGNPEGKKVPCKGSDGWQNSSITKHDLSDYPNMEMLGLVLGKKYLSIDADGVTALEKLSEILGELGLELPETLEVSSNLGVRHCWFFEIPESFQGNLDFFQIETKKATETESNEQLEFRTGKQYQIIAGIHPLTKSAYLSNQNFSIAELPSSWIEFIQTKGDSEKIKLSLKSSAKKSSSNSKKQEVEILPASLYAFLSRETKAFLRYGICEGSRNVASFKAACDLLGTAAKLEELEIPFEGSPERMFFEVFSKIPQGTSEFSIEEFQTCWNSANNQDRDCVKDEEILKSIAGLWEDEYQPGVSYEVIEDRISRKLGENPEKIKKESLVANFKKNFPSPTSAEVQIEAQIIYRELGYKGFGSLENDLVFNSLVKELTAEEISEEEKKALKDSIKSIQENKKKKINIQYVRDSVKTKEKNALGFILDNAESNNINIDYTLISFYTTISSLLPKHLKFMWNGTGRVRPNIFTLIVAPPTYGKDEIFRPITSALHDLSIDANNKFIADKKLHKRIEKDWNEIPRGERKEIVASYANSKGLFPDEMQPSEIKALFFEMNNCPFEVTKNHPYLINQSSLQYISKESGEHKNNGLLINPSEIADFLSNLNRVNKDKQGADAMIQIWNGANTNAEVKTEELQQEADYFQCSLLSGIQNKRFRDYIKADDPSGIASRFLYLNLTEATFQPTRAYEEAIEKVSEFDLKEFYLDFQTKLNAQIPVIEEVFGSSFVEKKQDYLVSFEKHSKALEILDIYRIYCENKSKELEASSDAAFQWYRRLAENTVKFALTIQCLRWYYGLEKSIKYISEESITQAVMLGQFLESQYTEITEVVTGNKSSMDDESLFIYERMLSVTIKYADKNAKDFVCARDLVGDAILKRKDFMEKYCNKKAKQMNKPEIHTVWQEMHDLGLGTFDKVAGSFKPNRELVKA
jgi:Protein of unknown function (DUF3987)/Bifunctional DNA primase/polymerase, N-terminal